MKKIIFFDVIFTFLLAFLFHNLYKYIPNFIFSIFFPVNESIWEHMKLLFTTVFFSDLFLYFFFFKKKKINNYFLSSFITSLLSIPIYLIIFLPIYFNFGENFIFSILLMLFVIILAKYFKYKIIRYKNLYLDIFSIILIIIYYLVFLILTYYPMNNLFFLDSINNCFGICK